MIGISSGTINGQKTHGREPNLARVNTVAKIRPDVSAETEPVSATDRVAFGIVRALEQQRLVPGQRLVESDLAAQFGVGRNAVREAIQRLAARGIVDLSRNRSPTIRILLVDEVLEVLDVAEALTSLLTRAAAHKFNRLVHMAKMRTVMDELNECEQTHDRNTFSRARRRFYRALLDISSNRELGRLFSAIHMEIVYTQYQSPKLQAIRFADYRSICEAIIAGDVKTAEMLGRRHVKHIRNIILKLEKTPEQHDY
jgi:DNA-binding GntR family transcriptional regulator